MEPLRLCITRMADYTGTAAQSIAIGWAVVFDRVLSMLSTLHESIRFWQTLSLTPGVGRAVIRAWADDPGRPRSLSAVADFVQSHDPGLAKSLRSPPREVSQSIEASLRWADADHCHLVTLDDPRYPAALATIADPPPVLHLKGQPLAWSAPIVAVVGSRQASPDGLTWARSLSGALAEHGVAIASGLAAGIDHAAHLGALDAGGISIAVIGTGVDLCYPARHRPTVDRLVEHGALISELPLGAPPLTHHFPRRNRIIAGLAAGVLVVQAARRSGSLITARLALENGREVLAVPGSVHSPLHRGCHQLIREGACLVETIDDVIAALPASVGQYPLNLSSGTGGRGRHDDANDSDSVSESARVVLAQIGWSPADPDDVLEIPNVSPGDIARLILELELGGWIERGPDGRIQRVR